MPRTASELSPRLSFPDGVLVVDKPAGPTSHDIVAVARRMTGVKKVGHTGTLDPLASGVLPLVLGRATRLAQFLSGAEKEYDADIELGASTTTYDRAGTLVVRGQPRAVSSVTDRDVEDTVASLRGVLLQQPPAFSAKKIDGDRAYDLARKNADLQLEAVAVTAHLLEVVAWTGTRLRVRLICSAGFYVRSLAHEIGERLGTGAHLAGLIRTRSGDFTLDGAVSIADLDRNPAAIADRVVRLEALLPAFPALRLTAEGIALAGKGNFVTSRHLEGAPDLPETGRVRLIHPDGHLVAVAVPKAVGGRRVLHPGVVLE